MNTATIPTLDRSKLVLDDNEILSKAVARFNRDRRSEGLPPCQPSVHLSEVVENVVILRNVNGDLAQYKITPSLRLRPLPSEDSGIDSTVDGTIAGGRQPHWVSLVVKRTVAMSVQVIATNAADAEEAVKAMIQHYGIELDGVHYLDTPNDFRGYAFVREAGDLEIDVQQTAAVSMSESRVSDVTHPNSPDSL